MEFRKIIYFLKVAETLNYRRAAEELYISPQALSKQIQELEHILGYALLRRSTTKVELTEDGKIFYTRFRTLRDEWQAAWEESARKPKVCFSYFVGAAHSRGLERLISILTEQYGDWDLEIESMDLPRILEKIQTGQADLGYTSACEGEQYTGCELVPVETLPTLLYMPQNHPLAEKECVTMEDLLHTEFLFVKGEKGHKGTIFEKIEEQGCVVYVNDNISVLSAIRTGKGVALLPARDEFLAYPGIAGKPLQESIRTSYILGLIWKKGHILERYFRQLGKMLAGSEAD